MKRLVSEVKQGVLIVYAPDYVDLYFKQDIADLIEHGWNESVTTILLNMEKVELINSHGASGVLELYNFLNNNGSKMAICAIEAGMVKDMCRDTGILFLCGERIYPDEGTALNALNSEN